MSKQALKWKEKGNAEFKKGNHGKAIEYYTYATELDPKNHIFFTNRATAYFKMKKYDKSLRDANKSIKLNNDWWKGHLKKAESLLKLERFDEAEAAAKLGGQIFSSRTQFATIEKQARRARMSGMSDAEILKIEGNELFKNGQIDQAVAKYTEAIGCAESKTPEGRAILATVYSNRAACNRQLYLHDKVVKDCTKALKFSDLLTTDVKVKARLSKIYIRRAQSYESMEQYEQSLEDWMAASRMGGGTVATAGASRVRNGLRQLRKMKAQGRS